MVPIKDVRIDTEIFNEIYFNNSIIGKLFLTIPQEVLLFWKPVLIHAEKPTGFARWDNGIFHSIYIDVNTQQITNCMFKFLYVDGAFVFDSIYANYDIEKQVKILPYENRYNSSLDIVAVYKRETVRIDGINYTQHIQYKNNKKTKEYYLTQEETPIANLQDLIDMDAIEYDKLKQNINLYQWRVRDVPGIVVYCIRPT